VNELFTVNDSCVMFVRVQKSRLGIWRIGLENFKYSWVRVCRLFNFHCSSFNKTFLSDYQLGGCTRWQLCIYICSGEFCFKVDW